MNYFKLIRRIEINPTELCNLTCSFCPRGNGYPNQNLHIDLDTVREIRKQLDESGYNKLVSVTGRGEPTLTKDFDKLLDILFDNNPKYSVYMNTNGKKLDKYEKYIPKFYYINYDVYENSTAAIKIAKRKYKKYPNVRIKFKPDLGGDYGEWNEDKGWVKESYMNFSNRGGALKTKEKNNHQNQPCNFLFEKMYINYNGDYNLCCDDWVHLKMSNIFDESMPDYINKNKNLKKYRKMHLSGKRSCHGLCVNCDRVAPLGIPVQYELHKYLNAKDGK